MGVLYSIPLCSRGTVKDTNNEDTPNDNLDKNNNDPTLVINNQPVILPPSTKITSSSSSITPPNATSTPKRAGSCSSNTEAYEDKTGFVNENAEHFAIENTDVISVLNNKEQHNHLNNYGDENLEDDAIGPVVDQILGGSSDDDLDSGLETSVSVERTLDAFRRRHNLNILDSDRSIMTPPPPALHPSNIIDDAYDECFDEILCNDEDDYDEYDDTDLQPGDDEDSDACCSISDDATINVEDVDSRDENLSCSDTDPVERPPEPQPVQDQTSRDVSPFSPSSNVSSKDCQETLEDPEVSISLDEQVTKANSSTAHAITSILSELVGDAPHNDHHTNVAISR